MELMNFTKEHIPEAIKLLLENYEEERSCTPVLPNSPALPPLEYFAENDLGVAAAENGKLLGFLCGYDPWNPVYCTPNTTGIWSPLHGHAVQKENRKKIWQRLYQSAADKWAKSGAASHAITLYHHDFDALHALFFYGFGARCKDFLRPLTPIVSTAPPGIDFAELPAADSPRLHLLRSALVGHLGESPCFMRHTPEDLKSFLLRRETAPPRMFAAFDHDKPVAYMELDDEGENFAACTSGTGNICGAYCLPEYRGTGIASALVGYIIDTLRQSGYARLGVDCETFNPTAMGFWGKFFTPYTISVVRRIDENAVKNPVSG